MKRLVASAAFLAFLGPGGLAGQQDVPTFTESVGTEYVMLPVVVFDKKGRFVEDLEEKDFRVHIGETTVDIDTFEKDANAPVSFAFLVDTSGSMDIGDKLDNAKEAIRSIISRRHPGDDYALFSFADEAVHLVTDFSRNPAKLLQELGELGAGGMTALFDAVAVTPSKMLNGRNSKRAILLFTDGVDNASKMSAVEMAEILQQVSTPVYAIGTKSASFDRLTEEKQRDLSVDNLRLLANSSGGKMFLVGGEDDLRPIAAQIDEEVRKQYLLGFAPSGRGEVTYRVVIVSVVKPGNWVVRTRRGYRGTAPVATKKFEAMETRRRAA
jgi:VWFA-related protein